jgi:hypothetical protein
MYLDKNLKYRYGYSFPGLRAQAVSHGIPQNIGCNADNKYPEAFFQSLSMAVCVFQETVPRVLTGEDTSKCKVMDHHPTAIIANSCSIQANKSPNADKR